MVCINNSWFETAFITHCKHLPRCGLENVITIAENVFNATHVATLGAITSLQFFKLGEIYLEITLLSSVAYCDVPTIPNGRVSWKENQCTSGTCRYTPFRTGFGEIYITCDPGYHLSGYGNCFVLGIIDSGHPFPHVKVKFLNIWEWQISLIFYSFVLLVKC